MNRQFLLGTSLITLVEPHPGHELAYNHWYESDHFYSGVMAGPAAFAGARWARPQRLKELPGARPDGTFLATYWIENGRHDEFMTWAVSALGDLSEAGRMFAERDLLDTAFCSLEDDWVSTDPDQVTPELALDRRYAGLIATRGGDPPELGVVGLRLTMTPLDGEPEPFHLCFVDVDPAEAWGRVTVNGARWRAAFVPTVPGTLRVP